MERTIISRDSKKKVTRKGRTWELPTVLPFEGNEWRNWFYGIAGYRWPKPGEYYISGAIPMAYKAERALKQEYLIAIPLEKVEPATGWRIKRDD